MVRTCFLLFRNILYEKHETESILSWGKQYRQDSSTENNLLHIATKSLHS